MMTLARQIRYLRVRTLAAVLTSIPFGLFAVTLVVALVVLWAAIQELRHGVPFRLALSGLVVFIAAAFVARLLAGALHHPFDRIRVVPYFNRSVNGSLEAFLSGFELARCLPILDTIASSRGVPPLSQFGFADDRLDQHLVWHDPALATEPVRALLGTADIPGRRDLEALAAALHRAAAHEASFCLVLRLGADAAMSLYEMDQRKGKFL